MIPLLERLRHVPDILFQGPFAPLVAQALAALEPGSADLPALLSSTDRGTATRVFARTYHRSFLPAAITLARDGDAGVRAEAASVLSWWAVHEPESAQFVQQLLLPADEAGLSSLVELLPNGKERLGQSSANSRTAWPATCPRVSAMPRREEARA